MRFFFFFFVGAGWPAGSRARGGFWWLGGVSWVKVGRMGTGGRVLGVCFTVGGLDRIG